MRWQSERAIARARVARMGARRRRGGRDKLARARGPGEKGDAGARNGDDAAAGRGRRRAERAHAALDEEDVEPHPAYDTLDDVDWIDDVNNLKTFFERLFEALRCSRRTLSASF